MPATIRNRRDFLAATARGRRFVTGSFILQMVKRTADHPVDPALSRIGYTVTKKIGNAVIRNRTKRRLRSAAQQAAQPLMQPGHDYVVIARHKAADCDFSELTRDMGFAFSRIIHHKNPDSK